MESLGKESLAESPLSSIQPSDEYLALSLKPSTLTSNPNKKQLLCLDLNGTLCVRSKRSKKNFCVRPHLQSFFEYIFHNFTVMVWSSAREHSVDNMCKMFGRYQPVLIWNRSHFNLSAEEYLGNIETLKDLNLIWDHLPEFNATNTIVLDDSSHKLAAHPYNLIKMSTFHNSYFSNDDFMDRDLCKVANYLSLLKEQSNICNFMRFVPFDVELPWGTVPDRVEDRRIEYYRFGKLERSSKGRPLATTIPRNIDITLMLEELMNPTDLGLYTEEAIKRLKEIQAKAMLDNDKQGQKQVRDQDVILIEDKDNKEDDTPPSPAFKKQRTKEQIIALKLKNQRRRSRKKERKAAGKATSLVEQQ